MTARQSASRPPRSASRRHRGGGAGSGGAGGGGDGHRVQAEPASEDSIASTHLFPASSTAPTTPSVPSPPSTAVAPPRSFPSFFSFLLGLDGHPAEPQALDLDDAWSVATKRRGVYNLFQVPARLERLLTLGHFICMDEFLTVFTTLPLRVVLVAFRALLTLVTAPINALRRRRKDSRNPAAVVHRRVANFIDVLHASLLLFTALALRCFDISFIYHNIRGQSVIKLYVVFNVIEIFDRLCSSFGVDILDSLGWTTCSAVSFFSRMSGLHVGSNTQELARARAVQGFALLTRMAFDYLFTLVYLVVHAALLLTWVVTLNVAINTQNNALLTLLVSNNFVELKGSVFKSFKVQNLFQISCSDAVERFQLNVFLAIMLVVTSGDHRLFSTWAVIYTCEVIVDWIKHAFVTKFNRISHRVYYQFSLVICDDMVNIRKHAAVRSIGGSAVSKRIGFVSLPLAALVIRMVFAPAMTLPTPALGIIFVTLLLLKTAISIGLIGHAHRKMKTVSGGSSVEVGEDEDRDNDLYWHQKLINVERYDHISKS